MLLRHKLKLRGAKDIKFGELIKQYNEMFKEVATLVFDLAIYLTQIDEKEKDLLVSQFEQFY
jgi:SHS2 domain-containing protein